MDIQRLEEIDREIGIIKQAAQRLKEYSNGIQAIDCNARRILASAKMLEINVSDLLRMSRK